MTTTQEIYGTAIFSRFNSLEHAGLCTVCPVLIGAFIVADYMRRSLEASDHVAGGERCFTSNLQIDALQEKLIMIW